MRTLKNAEAPLLVDSAKSDFNASRWNENEVSMNQRQRQKEPSTQIWLDD